jgi:hypothetical protein
MREYIDWFISIINGDKRFIEEYFTRFTGLAPALKVCWIGYTIDLLMLLNVPRIQERVRTRVQG